MEIRRAFLMCLVVLASCSAGGDGGGATTSTVAVTRPAVDRPASIESSVTTTVLGETIQVSGTCGIDPTDERLDADDRPFSATIIGAKVTELDGTEPLFQDQFVEVVDLDLSTDGEFDQPLVIPDDIEPGGYELRLRCNDPTTTLDAAVTAVRVERP